LPAWRPGHEQDGRVYLVSGGSEAIETASSSPASTTSRPATRQVEDIARWQSYHGSTWGRSRHRQRGAARDVRADVRADAAHPAVLLLPLPVRLTYRPAKSLLEELETAIHQEGPESVAAFIASRSSARRSAPLRPWTATGSGRARSAPNNVLLIADE